MRTPIAVPRMRALKSRRVWNRRKEHALRSARLFAIDAKKGSR